jgi:outer membrane protein TolC
VRAEPVDFVDLFHQAQAFHESVAEAREQRIQAENERDKVFANLLPTLSVEGDINRRKDTETVTAGTSSFVIAPRETRDLTVTLGQTLYTGGRATTQLKIATIGEVAGEIGERIAREQLVFDLGRAYFDVLKAEADLDSATERREGMESQLKAAQARVRLGADVKASALRLESEVARLKAEEVGDRHALKSARENLANLTGAPEDVELGAPPDTEAILALQAPLQAALTERADVNVQTGEVAAAKLGVRFTTGRWLPLVELKGTYAKHEEDPSGSFFIDEESFATLRATWDLYNGGEDMAERRRARSAYREQQLELERLKRDVRTEVEQASRQVTVAGEIVTALEEALRSATENHRIVTETYKAGAATYLDVIDASTALGDARRDLENARHDQGVALLGLARATGRLLTLVGEPLPSYERLHKWVEKAR